MSESNEITFDLNELKEVEELDKKLELLQGMLEQIEETAEDYDTTVLLDVGGEQIERDIRDIKRRLKAIERGLQKQIATKTDVKVNVTVPEYISPEKFVQIKDKITGRIETIYEVSPEVAAITEAIISGVVKLEQVTKLGSVDEIVQSVVERSEEAATEAVEKYAELTKGVPFRRGQARMFAGPEEIKKFAAERFKVEDLELIGQGDVSVSMLLPSDIDELGEGYSRKTYKLGENVVLKQTKPTQWVMELLANKEEVAEDELNAFFHAFQTAVEGLVEGMPVVLERGIDYVIVELVDVTPTQQVVEVSGILRDILRDLDAPNVESRYEDIVERTARELGELDESFGTQFSDLAQYIDTLSKGETVKRSSLGTTKEGRVTLIDPGAIFLGGGVGGAAERGDRQSRGVAKLVETVFGSASEGVQRTFEVGAGASSEDLLGTDFDDQLEQLFTAKIESQITDLMAKERAYLRMYEFLELREDIQDRIAKVKEQDVLEALTPVMPTELAKPTQVPEVINIVEMVKQATNNIVIDLGIIGKKEQTELVNLVQQVTNRYIKQYILSLLEQTV